MPIVDNRPLGTSSGGTGGAAIAVDETKSDWKNEEISINGLDIANGYITLAFQPQDTKVLCNLLGVGELDNSVDYTVNKPLSRVEFVPATLAQITASFALHGTLTLKAAYFAVTTI